MPGRLSIVMLVMLSFAGSQATAQDWPTKPIRFIVPYAAGGGNDTMSRLIANRVSETLGQPVVIDNRPGASTLIGTSAVAQSEPDGYTFLYTASLALNELLYASKSAKTRDFIPVALTVATPLVLTAHPAMPASFADFIAYGKANPGKINYPTFGKGTLPHLVCEMISSSIGVTMTDVAYRGSAPAAQDLLRGEMHVMCDTPAALVHVREGKLRAYGVMARERFAIAPDIPTFAELGHPDIVSYSVQGVYAPAGTPRSIVDAMNREINKALRDETVLRRIRVTGGKAGGGGPDVLEKSLAEDEAIWSKVIRRLNLKLE